MVVIGLLLISFWGHKVHTVSLKIPHPNLPLFGERSDFTWNSVGPEGGEVSRISTNISNPNQKIAVSFRLWNKQGGSPWAPISDLWHSLDGTFTGPNKAVVAFDEGIYYSNDGGVSWFPSLSYLSFQALSEHKGDTVFVVADSTVFLSTDGGLSFQSVSPVGINIMKIDYDPMNPFTLYAGAEVGDTSAAILKSVDAGVSWSWAIPPNSPFGITEVYDIEVNPWNSNEVLAAVGMYGPGTILISEDAGATWDTVMGAFAGGLYSPTDIEFLSGDTILVSNYFYKGIYMGLRTGPEFIFFKIDSTAYPLDLDIGSDGSITVATTSGVLYAPSLGSSFVWQNEGLKNIFLFREPQWSNMVDNRLIVLPSFTGGALYRTTNGGQTWERVIIDRMITITSVRISPTNPDVVYLTGIGVEIALPQVLLHTIYKSIDFGSTWTPVNSYSFSGSEYFPFPEDIHISPSNSNDLLIAADDSLYRSIDGGVNMSGLFPNVYTHLPGDEDFVFVYREDTGDLMYTLNHGDTWQTVGLTVDYPSNIELNPFDQSLYLVLFDIYTGTYRLIKVTTTGDVDTLLDLGQYAFFAGLEVSSNGGVYTYFMQDQNIFVFGRSNDFGQTWEFDTTEAFPGTFIRASSDQVILSTFGLSFYRSTDAVTTVAETENSIAQPDILVLTPIVSKELRLIYTSAYQGNLNVGVFNPAGRRVYLSRLLKTRRSLNINIPFNKLPSGAYFIKIHEGTGTRRAVKFLKIK